MSPNPNPDPNQAARTDAVVWRHGAWPKQGWSATLKAGPPRARMPEAATALAARALARPGARPPHHPPRAAR
eukprot:scaffold1548_cov50-Phaeocystis_antarctica.AAC.7